MEMGVILFVTAIFTAIHIAFWHMFPKKLRHMLIANPVLAFIVDFAGSGLITTFTGVASYVGIANMAASVCFGLYAVICIQVYGIKGIETHAYKVWKIPVWPKMVVRYVKNGRSWVE